MDNKFSKQELSMIEGYITRSDIQFFSLQKDPYWLVRAKALNNNLAFFGSYAELQRLYQNHLLGNLAQREDEPQLQEKYSSIASADPFEKKFGVTDLSWIETQNQASHVKKNLHISSYIPEIKKINKNLSYTEIYSSIIKFTDPHFVFVNMFKPNPQENLISAVVLLPYSPEILSSLSYDNGLNFIMNLAKYLNLQCNYAINSNDSRLMFSIIKQKLYDLYYLATDSEDLHAVVPCHSDVKICANIVSSFCENKLCKPCCQSLSNLVFCPMHHRFVNYYRYKAQFSLEFENAQSFNRATTLKISFKGTPVPLSTLKEVFVGYLDIAWEATQIFYHPQTERISDLYIVCNTNEEARRIYDDRLKLMQNWVNLEFSIFHLIEPIEDIICSVSESQFSVANSGLLVFPLESLSRFLPKKGERLRTFQLLIESTLKIRESDYRLFNCKNLINNDLSYNYFIVSFACSSVMNKFYSMQPFYDCVVLHKLSHFRLFPLLRYSTKFARNHQICLNCTEKAQDLDLDLCSNCSLLSVGHPLADLIRQKLKKYPHNQEESISIEDPLRILKKRPPVFLDSLLNLEFNELKEQLTVSKSLFTINFIEFLKNSDFSFFRPISNTSVTRLMLDMNKEMAVVMDNPNYKRENPMRIKDRMYKCLTFQLEKEAVFNLTKYHLVQACDKSGNFYNDFDFTRSKDGLNSSSDHLVKVTEESLSTCDSHAYSNIQSVSNKSYHIMIYGIDASYFSYNEIVDEIYNELRNKEVKILKEDINILNENAVINFIVNQSAQIISRDYLYDRLSESGRHITLKLQNVVDALKIFSQKIKLNLPLVNNYRNQPQLIPGSLLVDYIDSLIK